jgi:hypothetical protein
VARRTTRFCSHFILKKTMLSCFEQKLLLQAFLSREGNGRACGRRPDDILYDGSQGRTHASSP